MGGNAAYPHSRRTPEIVNNSTRSSYYPPFPPSEISKSHQQPPSQHNKFPINSQAMDFSIKHIFYFISLLLIHIYLELCMNVMVLYRILRCLGLSCNMWGTWSWSIILSVATGPRSIGGRFCGGKQGLLRISSVLNEDCHMRSYCNICSS